MPNPPAAGTAKVAIVTGPTSGIGRATAEALAAQGLTIILGCRDAKRGEFVREQIEATTGNAALHVVELDLARFASVRSFAETVQARFPKIHVLVNNAGLLVGTRRDTPDRIEHTFQVNHLAPFLLTRLLVPRLRESVPARVVFVASEAERQGRIDFDDPGLGDRWTPFAAYAQSKLANIVCAYAMARRLERSSVTVNCVHPGLVRTGWAREASGLFKAAIWLGQPFMRSPAKGADTVVFMATDPSVATVSGAYYQDRHAIQSQEASYDEDVQTRLWDTCEEMLAHHGFPSLPALAAVAGPMRQRS